MYKDQLVNNKYKNIIKNKKHNQQKILNIKVYL